MDSEINFIFRNTSFNFRNLLFCVIEVFEDKGLLMNIVGNSKEVMLYFRMLPSLSRNLFFIFTIYFGVGMLKRDKVEKNGKEGLTFLVLLDYTIPNNESPSDRGVSPNYL